MLLPLLPLLALALCGLAELRERPVLRFASGYRLCLILRRLADGFRTAFGLPLLDLELLLVQIPVDAHQQIRCKGLPKPTGGVE